MITATKLLQKISNKKDLLLINVGEEFEPEQFNIGGQLMPMGNVLNYVDEIPTKKQVIFYCEKGNAAVLLFSDCKKNLAIPIY